MRNLLLLLVLATAWPTFAQPKVLTFTDYQKRNELQQWKDSGNSHNRTAKFSKSKIDVRLDRDYHLNITNTTHLPDKGVVYLCRDERKREVTVMLISNQRMFLYDGKKRYLVQFDPPGNLRSSKNAYADLN